MCKDHYFPDFLQNGNLSCEVLCSHGFGFGAVLRRIGQDDGMIDRNPNSQTNH